jgi:F-type H+-transporting ATPase subunit epsilon
MTDTLRVDVVTPENLAFSEEVGMVEVPGELGDFGVLPGHAPFISLIRPGMIRIHTEGEPKQFFVTSGVAEVTPEYCTILAEAIHDRDELTLDEAKKQLELAKKRLEKADEHDVVLSKAVDEAEAMVEALSN